MIDHQDNEHIQERIKKLQVILATKAFGSANWLKVKEKINKLHRKAKLRTRRNQQYHAQWLANGNGQITIESYTSSIASAPVPRADGEGGYLPNNAERIAQSNEKRAKVATAQFVTLIKEKAAQTGAVLIDNRKQSKVKQKSPTPPQADVKQPKSQQMFCGGNTPSANTSQEHGQSRKRQQGGKGQTDSQVSPIAEPSKTRSGRNRKREQVIG